MRAALRLGIGVALRRLPLVATLWVVNMLFGGAFAGLSAAALTASLDSSWFTRSLLYHLDFNAFAALVAHDLGTLEMLGAAGVVLAALYLIGWLWLHSAVAAAAAAGDDPLSISEALQSGARYLPVFARLYVLSSVATVGSVGAIGLGTQWLMRRAEAATAESAWEVAIGTGGAIAALVLVFCVAVHDNARLRAVISGSGAWRSYRWALGFVTAGGRWAFALTVTLLLVHVLLWGLYQRTAQLLPVDTMSGVVLALAWGEAWMGARMFVRVWTFAAVAELQVARE